MTGNSVPHLLTVRQFAARHPAFTEGSLRWLIFLTNQPDAASIPAYARGIDAAIVRLGRRVLIDEQAFLAWVRKQGGRS